MYEDSVLQLYVDADTDPNVSTVLKFLDDEIDLKIAAEDGQFVQRGWRLRSSFQAPPDGLPLVLLGVVRRPPHVDILDRSVCS
ncbi:hypothetical protein [Halorubrum sp. FL23]|uniref:hypothetical protein n=1 Tax=Halorubrum sp. FL23 TaxID=3458704 RepID=UPI00403459A0